MLKISVVIGCLICFYCIHALPHCKVINLPKEFIQWNTINVIYTMKSSCKFCTRKATMLPGLKMSLQRAGIRAHFIVAVNNKSDRLSGLAPHVSMNKRQIWKTLGEQNNHFYIIDRCGRMVYEIINPWSSIQMPFLRGAIIATQFSHPCGLCPQDYTMVEEENLKIYPPMIEKNQSEEVEDVPLGIVMRLRHVHEGDPNIYNHIVMRAHGTPGHHQHLPNEAVTKQSDKPILSLNLLEEKDEAYKVSSISSDVTNNINVNKQHLSTEQTSANNSINNLAYNSLRMANETQLVLSSGELKDSSLHNTTPSEVYTETSFTEQSDYLETFTEVNSANEEPVSNDDYLEASSEELDNVHEESELTSDEIAEKETLKEHYKKILDWVDHDI